MKKIDFLSVSPRNYIFQKDIYKTNFGGILFLIYCVIMLFISLAYILDYAFNEKVETEYLKYQRMPTDEEIFELNSDPNYNPTLEFKIRVNVDSNPNLMDNITMIFLYDDRYYISKEKNY